MINKPTAPTKSPLWKAIGLDRTGEGGAITTETSILRLKSGFFLRTLSTKRGAVVSESLVWVERAGLTELDKLEELAYGRRSEIGR